MIKNKTLFNGILIFLSFIYLSFNFVYISYYRAIKTIRHKNEYSIKTVYIDTISSGGDSEAGRPTYNLHFKLPSKGFVYVNKRQFDKFTEQGNDSITIWYHQSLKNRVYLKGEKNVTDSIGNYLPFLIIVYIGHITLACLIVTKLLRFLFAILKVEFRASLKYIIIILIIVVGLYSFYNQVSFFY